MEKSKKLQEKQNYIPFEKQNVISPLKMIVIVVRQGQREAIEKILQEFNVALSLSMHGTGRSFKNKPNSILSMEKKSFIFAVIRGDKEKDLTEKLSHRFSVSHAAQGIAYTIDLTSVAGVSIYKFLSDTRKVKKVSKNGKNQD